jgi:hypothetical protein
MGKSGPGDTDNEVNDIYSVKVSPVNSSVGMNAVHGVDGGGVDFCRYRRVVLVLWRQAP